MKLPSGNAHLVPDLPLAIGYKCSWYAVKDTDVRKLAALFGLGHVHDCNWAHGLAAAAGEAIFISPAVRGWHLVLGRHLSFGDAALAGEVVAAQLVRLSHLAGEAQFFATHRVVEFHCWMRARAGALERDYAYLGDHGAVELDLGAQTIGEPADLVTAATLDLWAENEELELSFPDEELVMAIAAAWSLDPNDLATGSEVPGLGVVGAAPRQSQPSA